MAESMPDKPRRGQPCNGCGLCCRAEVCSVGVAVFGEVPAPCPGILIIGGITRCAVVIAEAELSELPGSGIRPYFAEILGIGLYCDTWTLAVDG